jgi:hypothetical protein
MAMTANEMGPAEERRRAFSALNSNWEVQDVTSLAEAESKYGHVVQSAGGQVFGIESAASWGRREEKLKIGTPDGFLKIDVVLNQPNINAVLRERTKPLDFPPKIAAAYFLRYATNNGACHRCHSKLAASADTGYL